jgi:hypothetical protein
VFDGGGRGESTRMVYCPPRGAPGRLEVVDNSLRGKNAAEWIARGKH